MLPAHHITCCTYLVQQVITYNRNTDTSIISIISNTDTSYGLDLNDQLSTQRRSAFLMTAINDGVANSIVKYIHLNVGI